MSSNDVQGKRFICMLRQSNTEDGTTSVEAQLTYLMQEGKQRGMVYVDKVSLEGLTGSLPGKRQDMTALVERKQKANDFDVLLVQRIDRLTRSGSGHGFWFEHECIRAGIQVIFVGDDIPDGRYANLIKVAKYDAAFEQAFSTSQRSTQGMQHALQGGHVITCTHTPYGCWRLYLTADGVPSHIIRDLGDGRQEKLHPETQEVIDTYGFVGGNAIGHYRKQKLEKVLLMPGDPHEVEVVREIFHLHFVEGWGGKRIADVLNSRGIPSSWNKQWSQRQVEITYEQEAYTGRTVGNRKYSGIHHKRDRRGPQPLNRDAFELATAKAMRPTIRPIEDWEIQKQPLMEGFLHANLRDLAMAAHEKRWQEMVDPTRPAKPKSKHAASSYLLSNLLTAKQDGEKLVGLLTGKQGHKTRYYRHKKGRRGYQKGRVYNKLIPAEPLEKAVLEVVGGLLLEMPSLRERLLGFVKEQLQTSGESVQKLDELRQQRDRVKKRTELLIKTFDVETLADAKGEIDRLSIERKALDEQIANIERMQKTESQNPEAVVENVIQTFKSWGEELPSMSAFALRKVLDCLLASLTCDMETKEIELELALPSWILWEPERAASSMCLEGSYPSPASLETHQQNVAELQVARCYFFLQRSRTSCQCQRIDRAA